ncbi:MAG: hypothetical protein Q4B52_05360 [Tissierellia bacterium]|nr:hypothetical protein [Tissierellia bacterium]
MYEFKDFVTLEIMLDFNKSIKIYFDNINILISEIEAKLVILDIRNANNINWINTWINEITNCNEKTIFLIYGEYPNKCKTIKNNLLFGKKLCIDKSIELDEKIDLYNVYLNVDNFKNKNLKKLEVLSNKELFIEFQSKKCDLEKTNLVINNLYKSKIDFSLSTLYKDRNHILQHPCNIYLCNGKNCHSNKNGLPKYLYVNEKGIFPYKSLIEELSFFNNINTDKEIEINKIFVDYMQKDAYKRFILCNKYIYREFILVGSSRIMPWNIYLNKAYYMIQGNKI